MCALMVEHLQSIRSFLHAADKRCGLHLWCIILFGDLMCSPARTNHLDWLPWICILKVIYPPLRSLLGSSISRAYEPQGGQR